MVGNKVLFKIFYEVQESRVAFILEQCVGVICFFLNAKHHELQVCQIFDVQSTVNAPCQVEV